jgi:putative transposase
MALKKYPWRTGRSCQFKNFYHLVFVTKYRRDVFTHSMLLRIQAIFQETCQQMDCVLLEFNGEDDHVHILISVPPKLSIAVLVGKLKGKSSYFIRQEFWNQLKQKLWGEHLWSPSYCCVTCGGAPLDIVKSYIENQRRPSSEKGIAQSLRERKVKIADTLK